MLKRRILWTIATLVMVAVLWALKIEVTYQHNVRHMPADFRIRPQHITYMWKA
jgi:hypothetical protein